MTLLQSRGLDLDAGPRRLLEGLNWRLEAGQCWGVLGPNGAGKSTLLHTLAGLRPPRRGTVWLAGHPLNALPPRRRARLLGVLFQQQAPQLPGTLLETVLGGRHPHLGRLGWESGEDLALARRALAEVGLEAGLHRDPATLSGGERQRLEIATLLAQDPRVALLDEPANHLDPGRQAQVLAGLTRRFVTSQRGCVMVLHDINQALRHCSHLLLLRGDGQWRAGPLERLARTETLRWLYDCPVTMLEHKGRRCFLLG